jgi:hypothetical protein
MGLFKSDLYRSLALGFVAGALGLAAVMGPGSFSDNVVSPAVAAPVEQR